MHRSEHSDDVIPHRTLLEGCARAREKLLLLVREHDDVGSYATALSRKENGGGVACSSACGSDASPEHARQYGELSAALSSMLMRSSSPRAIPPSADAPQIVDQPLTWTSAMGASDVHARLYGTSK